MTLILKIIWFLGSITRSSKEGGDTLNTLLKISSHYYYLVTVFWGATDLRPKDMKINPNINIL